MSEEAPKQSKLSPERLEKLKYAREKALEKKRLLKEIADKTKQLKETKIQVKKKELDEELEKHTKVLAPKPKEAPAKSKPKKKPVVVSDSESEIESEEEDEEVVVKQSKQKQKAAVKPREVPTSQLTAEIARQELQRRINEETYKQAYQSILGHNPYAMMI